MVERPRSQLMNQVITGGSFCGRIQSIFCRIRAAIVA